MTNKDNPIYITEDFLYAEECDDLVEKLLSRGHGGELSSKGGNPINERKTLQLLPTREEQADYYQKSEARKDAIGKFFRLRITGSEGISVPGYPPGGKYLAHCNNCIPIIDESGGMVRFDHNKPDRILTSILFLAESAEEITGVNQCIGGNIILGRFVDDSGNRLLIEPRKVLLIVFPSNPYYQHRVFPIHNGFHVTFVDWHSAEFL